MYREMISVDKINEKYLNELSKDKKRLNSWISFIKAKELKSYKIKNKLGKIQLVEGWFEGHYIHRLDILAKYFVIKKIRKREFRFERLVPKFKYQGLETIKNLIDFVKNKYQFEDDEEKSEELNGENNGLVWSSEEEKFENNLVSEVKVFERKEMKNKKIEKKDKQTPNRMKTEKNSEERKKLGNTTQNMNKKTQKNTITQKSSRKFNIYDRKKNMKIFEFLNSKISKKIKKRNPLVFKVIIIFIILTNLYFFTSIKKKKSQTFAIIKEHALSVDIYSWLIWAQTYTAISLDTIRFLRQSWIEPSYGGVFHKNNLTYMEKWSDKLKRTGQFFLSPENDLDTKARNESSTSDFYREKWINSEVIMRHSLSFLKYEPKEVLMERRSSILFLQGFSKNLYFRNYENDTDIPMLKSNEDRSKDPDEEIFRLNLMGDQNWVYFDLSHDFFQFITDVAQGYQNGLLLDSGILAIINLSLLVALGGYFIIEVRLVENELACFELKENSLNNLLLEEKDIGVKVINKKGKSIKKKTKKIGKFEDKLQINFEKYHFGLIEVLLSILLLTCLYQLAFTMTQLYLVPKATQVTNLLKVYILGSDTWSTMAILHTFFLQTVFFNNTMPCWKGKTSLDCYQITRDYMENLIVDNITESGNSCESLFNNEKVYFNQCPEFYDGMLTSNGLNSMRALLTTLEILIDEWQQKRGDFEKVKLMLKNKRFDFIFSMFDAVNAEIYYFFTVSSSNLLIEEITSTDKALDNMVLSSVVLIMFAGVLSYIILSWKIKEAFTGFYSVLFVVPKKLISSNMVLMHHLDRVRKGMKFY